MPFFRPDSWRSAGPLGLALAVLAGAAPAPVRAQPAPHGPPMVLEDFERDMFRLAHECEPYVVNVEARLVRGPSVEPGQSLQAGRRVMVPRRRIGSGIALDDQGTIITTASIVDAAQSIIVQDATGRTFNAEVIGLDRRTNVALLVAPGARTNPARLGESSLVTPGSRVVVVGSVPARRPLSSFGSIEIDRGLIWGYSEVEMLQLNAPIYRGHIGAPVINSEGRVIGMVCGTLDPTAAAQPEGRLPSGLAGYIYEDRIIPRSGTDVSFAIPIEKAQEIAAELKQNGRVDRGFLGVRVRRGPVTGGGRGIPIEEVIPGGPAATAGLSVGDAILDYAGQPVNVGDDVTFLVLATRPGSRVPITVVRRGQVRQVEVVVGLAPNLYPQSIRLSLGGATSDEGPPSPGAASPR